MSSHDRLPSPFLPNGEDNPAFVELMRAPVESYLALGEAVRKARESRDDPGRMLDLDVSAPTTKEETPGA